MTDLPVILEAPAKLTLSLHIRGVRADGYHLLEAEMVTLDLADKLVVAAKTGTGASSLEIISPTGSLTDSPADSWDSAPGSDNLVIKALEQVGRAANVVLHKNIPPGAGLGGGSADAAAILRWAKQTDLGAAANLGADVPFCLVGGRAKVFGIGEVVEPLPDLSETYTLLTPPFGCPTAAVYAMWDDMGGPQGSAGNDLEPAALKLEPRLKQYRDELAQVCGQRPRLAGSGSTWFVKGAFAGAGRLVVRTTPPAGIPPTGNNC